MLISRRAIRTNETWSLFQRSVNVLISCKAQDFWGGGLDLQRVIKKRQRYWELYC